MRALEQRVQPRRFRAPLRRAVHDPNAMQRLRGVCFGGVVHLYRVFARKNSRTLSTLISRTPVFAPLRRMQVETTSPD